MIKVKKENYFKVLKPELFKVGEKLLGKYILCMNETFKRIVFYKSFGSNRDFLYNFFNSFHLIYIPEIKAINIECCNHGGMNGFTFDEDTLNDKNLLEIDRECIEFTINFIKELIDNGVIKNENN